MCIWARRLPPTEMVGVLDSRQYLLGSIPNGSKQKLYNCYLMLPGLALSIKE